MTSISPASSPSSGAPPRLQPALSWSAIWAGAAVALAASLVLTLAAAGVGYAVGFPGLATRTSLEAFTPEVGAGAIAVQVLSAALGGYIAGRMRVTWIGVHEDESHFRDTAHGLIAWAVFSLLAVILAVTVLEPYAHELAAAQAAAAPPSGAAAERASNIAAQSSLFISIGMLLSAFVSAVAARLGGLQHETAYARSLA